MHNKNIKRILSTAGILLFFLPFFQMCSDSSLKTRNLVFKSQSDSRNQLEKNRDFEQAKKSATLTGYDLALNFEISVLSIFTVIMFLNFIIWVFTFQNFEIGILTFLNALLSLVAFIILVSIIPFGQLRYGIFLFQLNSLLLCYFVFKKE
ncbi:hypothetical protein IRZ71_06370 [Flavobacterium sp. ANB]|uniref:hypothetical protein n=1 Tax=unclassified Flavobacterium TaxID=196869 RepID=UPI0012B8B2E3|nr:MULTISPECIES: hypothetical protein [unclassified Flavobacterium]MBF4515957.1 hypothetical protein [Flavobacterium sp. ANB]MTD68959.1 hypothetical protein [Flavobacterium sp. LC2016-13]